MSLGTALSNVRWAERRAEAEAWAAPGVGRRQAAAGGALDAGRGGRRHSRCARAARGIERIGRRSARCSCCCWRRPRGRSTAVPSSTRSRATRCCRRQSSGRYGAQELARGSGCNSNGRAGARCGGHAGAPQPPCRRDVSQDQERPADEPGVAQPRSSGGRRSGADVGGAHRRRPRRTRAGGTARGGDRVAPGALRGAVLAARAHHLPRSHRAGSPVADARRFHRQCQPRAAHAARFAARLRRDAAGAGARRRQRPHALPVAHGQPGRAHDAPHRRFALAQPRRDARALAAARHCRAERDGGVRLPVDRASRRSCAR